MSETTLLNARHTVAPTRMYLEQLRHKAGEVVMLFVIFVIVAATVIVAHYFLIERPRQVAAQQQASLDPPAATVEPVPRGVFVQPTYTWSQITPSGELLMGVHPLLLNLIGAPWEVYVVPKERVEKGEPLFRVGKKDRRFTIRSPVSGELLVTREMVNGDTSWEEMAGGSRCLCQVEPKHVEDDVSTWMSEERAEAWSESQYEAIREHLLTLGADSQLGLTLADGGAIPVGALAELDEAEWEAFERRFLHG